MGFGFESRRRLRRPWPLPGLGFELGESFGSNSGISRGRSLCAQAGLAVPRRARSRANRKVPRGAKRSEQRAIMFDRSGSGAWNFGRRRAIGADRKDGGCKMRGFGKIYRI